ncbi:MAG TPA: NAD(P) transhydrogenase subunit alpha [Bacillota bacterium]|nr:NAD(P) transhydrogenase subunit alpha [Bacillota bacterium]HOI36065.1 NAD(P) transhydrogenase subunit alpha [Bacillota bacterium]HPU76638.1 NAD(P) transhydrogenase subunit alpha [Bacillota bacterium]
MSALSLVILFVVATVVGYRVISAVPSLLHTPLMSGTNALSGVTVLGALAVTAMAQTMGNSAMGQLLGAVAIVLAMINVVGGFLVTDRMLRMFKK